MSAEELTLKISAEVSEAVEGLKKVEDESQKLQDGMRKLVTGLSGVATSAFALYNAWDNVQDMQVSVSRANLQVQSTLNSLEDTQRRYNATVEKYGADSEQAAAAAKDLQLAQERYSVSVERAEMVQGNLNETIVRSALSVIPSLITMVDSVSKAKQAWTVAQHALNMAMAANPIGLVITVIAALISILIVAYTTCEPFRNAVNALGAALLNFFKPAVEAAINIVNSLGQVWNAMCSGIKAIWDATVGPLLAAIKGFADAVHGIFQTLFGWIVGGSVWRDLCGGLVSSWNSTAASLISGIQGFAANVKNIFSGLVSWVQNIWNGIVSAVTGAAKTVQAAASSATEASQQARAAAMNVPGATTTTTTTPKTTTTTTTVRSPAPVVQVPMGASAYSYQRGGFGIVKKPTIFLAGEAGPEAFAFTPLTAIPRAERALTISIGKIEIATQELGSPFDRARIAEDLAKQLTHKLALRVITR